MCSGAILLYRIPRVEVLGDADCVAMMTRFIEENPRLWNEDIGE